MDKQGYKDMLAESWDETNKYKKIVRTVEQMVKDEPNNMRLGKIIRQLYWELKDERDLANDKI
tara:strand:+ start:826 stop:1014 length:189 start_codon:yes stop_codon:yes gene_type:complete